MLVLSSAIGWSPAHRREVRIEVMVHARKERLGVPRRRKLATGLHASHSTNGSQAGLYCGWMNNPMITPMPATTPVVSPRSPEKISCSRS